MSQQRARKPSATREAVRPPLVRASGDTAVPTTRPKNNERSRSKNKIPKTIRYDLENALVGLCDVWFEDIKPHLIRNNIKLHVEGSGALGLSGCNNGVLPKATPGCSHLDPGAAPDHRRQSTVNCANCCSTRRTASRAPCPRQTVGVLTYHPTSQHKKSKQTSIKVKPNKSQALVPASPQARSKYRVLRPCRTCTFLPPSMTQVGKCIPVDIKNQHPSKHSRSHPIKQHRKVDYNRDPDTNTVNNRPKKLNSILRDEGIEMDRYPEIPKLNLCQRNKRKTKRERSPNHDLETVDVPSCPPKCKYSNGSVKEKTFRICSIPFQSIPDSKVKFKKRLDQRLNFDYNKHGLRKISSVPVGLCFNNYNKRSCNTRCATCSVQHSDCKIKSKHYDAKSHLSNQDVKVRQSKQQVSFNRKGANSMNDDHRRQNAPRHKFPQQKELNPSCKRLPAVEIEAKQSYDEYKSANEAYSDTKMCQNESVTKSQVTSLRRHDATKRPGRCPVSRMPDRINDDETPSTTVHKRNTKEPKLFDSDLIDIIVKQSDKRVKQLSRNQARDTSTAMNLAPGSPNKYLTKVRNVKNKPPWK